MNMQNIRKDLAAIIAAVTMSCTPATTIPTTPAAEQYVGVSKEVFVDFLIPRMLPSVLDRETSEDGKVYYASVVLFDDDLSKISEVGEAYSGMDVIVIERDSGLKTLGDVAMYLTEGTRVVQSSYLFTNIYNTADEARFAMDAILKQEGTYAMIQEIDLRRKKILGTVVLGENDAGSYCPKFQKDMKKRDI